MGTVATGGGGGTNATGGGGTLITGNVFIDRSLSLLSASVLVRLMRNLRIEWLLDPDAPRVR